MNESILVAYASRTGTTAGVAEAIGQTLAESFPLVDVRRMQEVPDLSPYGAVVAGSGIQNKQWLPEAMQFIRANQVELARKPCAIFLVCMTLAMNKGNYRQEVSAWLQPVRSLVRPVSEGLFAGALDISKVPSFKDRLGFQISVATGVWSEGDHRDWEIIHRWAASLPPLLQGQ
jgi:menaquinone-dependent protoporphyrinogen oxidase